MSKKFGLGKGLNALIPEDTMILDKKEHKTEVKNEWRKNVKQY